MWASRLGHPSLLLFVLIGASHGCGGTAKEAAPPKPEVSSERPGEIPAARLGEVMKAHLAGVGHMERYEYEDATAAFRKVHELAPGWLPGSVNLSIALLNTSGTIAEATPGGEKSKSNFEVALSLLDDVLKADPGHLPAHYCRGLILEFLGGDNILQAHEDFVFVSKADPNDGHTWYHVGTTLTDPNVKGRPAGPPQAKQLIEIYTKALEANPYLISALFKLQSAYSWAKDRDKQKELSALWRRLNPKSSPDGPGDTAENFYGEAGKYARVIDPTPPRERPAGKGTELQFAGRTPMKVAFPPSTNWAPFVAPSSVTDSTSDRDTIITSARAIWGPGTAVFDANNDGKLDLYLTAAVIGPKGLRDALFLNRGNGAFEDVTLALGLPEDRAGIGVAAGDFDADLNVDLFVTGVGDNRLLRNLGADGFKDVTTEVGLAPSKSISPMARWLDLDQDGDLDLYVLNGAAIEDGRRAFLPGKPSTSTVNTVYRNDGTPRPQEGGVPSNWLPLASAPKGKTSAGGLSLKLTPWTMPEAAALSGPPGSYAGIAALDVDDDRDLDLILARQGELPILILNDRLGRFRTVEVTGLGAGEVGSQGRVSGLVTIDLDRDGRSDLVQTSVGGPIKAWRNATTGRGDRVVASFQDVPIQASDWNSATAVDLDLDTWPDLLPVSLRAVAGPQWARNDGDRLVAQSLRIPGSSPEITLPTAHFTADFLGDALPEMIEWKQGEAPEIIPRLTNSKWLALDLRGKWLTDFGHMRTNPHGLGVKLTLEGQGLNVPLEVTTPSSGPGQSVVPAVLGMGSHEMADLLRLRWPDGTMQCELNVQSNVLRVQDEINRKTGSCPVLFTWNGKRFECLGDFLGGGGLGYLVAPGTYGQPDRDEAIAISSNQLRAVDGKLRLAIAEPMDEIAYLDHLTLDVVDRPPGFESTPDERFAPEGPRPTGELLTWRRTIRPEKATDLHGRDLSATLEHWDRRTADGFKKLSGWIGYAEEHGIVLDFGDRLTELKSSDRLMLMLAGWIDYPYSQTNYAAATAGMALKPPVLERRKADGTWEVIDPHPGYPAGLPRMMSLDLTGKLTGRGAAIRLTTNMECYYDQAFLALVEPAGEAVTSLPVSNAWLSARGYLREVSPDGELPLIYDYDYVDPAPLARLQGDLTRYGDVAGLVSSDDDRLCLVGPGDDLKLEFDASGLPPIKPGWTRSYVLRSIGYCKDADPFTAASDTVGPLPWKGMPYYPFGPEGERPMDDKYRDYLKTYQTRRSSGR
ncbi:FG-GAP-like repeat-containing protein [Isosphaeraceae bacterium EP7]